MIVVHWTASSTLQVAWNGFNPERLIGSLARRFQIQYLIGHLEYGRFKGSALWEERESEYFTVKPDPGADFMHRLRLRLTRDGLDFKDRP